MRIEALTRRRFVAGMGIGATSAVLLAACGESESDAPAAEAPAATAPAPARYGGSGGDGHDRSSRWTMEKRRDPVRHGPHRGPAWRGHAVGPGALRRKATGHLCEAGAGSWLDRQPGDPVRRRDSPARGAALAIVLYSLPRTTDAFTEITDELAKRDDFVPEDYYFLPDAYTFNNIDHSFPQPEADDGPPVRDALPVRDQRVRGQHFAGRGCRRDPAGHATAGGTGMTGRSGTPR